jgi:hypothetical protein
MMARWIYTMDGRPAYYQGGADIYAPDGRRAFWVREGWWHSMTEKPRYYVDVDHIFEAGRPVFYYAEE